jgi:transposase
MDIAWEKCLANSHGKNELERATYDSVAFRYIAANTHPDHDTLATFRKRFASQIEKLFVQVLRVAQELKLVKLGRIALDGTKVKANASPELSFLLRASTPAAS